MKTSEGISLLDELEMICDAIESAWVLADLLATGSALCGEDQRRLPQLLVSVIVLTQARLRLLRRVVLQQVSPELLKTRRNTRGRVEEHEDPDVVLLPAPVRPPRRRRR